MKHQYSRFGGSVAFFSVGVSASILIGGTVLTKLDPLGKKELDEALVCVPGLRDGLRSAHWTSPFSESMDLTRTAYGTWSGGRFMHFGEPLEEERFLAALR